MSARACTHITLPPPRCPIIFGRCKMHTKYLPDENAIAVTAAPDETICIPVDAAFRLLDMDMRDTVRVDEVNRTVEIIAGDTVARALLAFLELFALTGSRRFQRGDRVFIDMADADVTPQMAIGLGGEYLGLSDDLTLAEVALDCGVTALVVPDRLRPVAAASRG